MNKKAALKVIRSGQTAVWNGYRKDNPDWKPDLSYEDLSGYRLKHLDGTSFDFSEANLCGTIFSEEWTYMTRLIKNAKFNEDTKFPLFFDPYEYGATFVAKTDQKTNKEVILNKTKGSNGGFDKILTHRVIKVVKSSIWLQIIIGIITTITGTILLIVLGIL